jgi:hypothetical protein
MDWAPILAYLETVVPNATMIFTILGALVVVGTVVDSMIDDEKDGGFMKKLLAAPILGSLLSALKRFSPFNIKEEKSSEEK